MKERKEGKVLNTKMGWRVLSCAATMTAAGNIVPVKRLRLQQQKPGKTVIGWITGREISKTIKL